MRCFFQQQKWPKLNYKFVRVINLSGVSINFFYRPRSTLPPAVIIWWIISCLLPGGVFNILLLAHQPACTGPVREVRSIAAILRAIQGGLWPVQDALPVSVSLGIWGPRRNHCSQEFQGNNNSLICQCNFKRVFEINESMNISKDPQPLFCWWLIWPTQNDAKHLKDYCNPGTRVLICKYLLRAIQWIPT